MKRLILLAALTFAFGAPLLALDTAGLLVILNQERAAVGLSPLRPDKKLNTLAADWAKKAAVAKSLSHRKELPELKNSLCWNYLNENIYAGGGVVDAPRVFRVWMKSPGHRRNLLHPDLTHAGFGFSVNEDGETYVVFNGGAK